MSTATKRRGGATKGPPVPGDILTSGRIAGLLKVDPSTVSGWIDRGRLKGYRLPDSLDRRVHAADLVEFMLAHGMFRQVASCLVSDGGILYRATVHDRWGSPVARVYPASAPPGSGLDWHPGEESRYVLKAANDEAFQVLMNAGFRCEDGR